MAQLQKVKFFGQEQFTIPDIENLQDFVEEDFHIYNSKYFTETSKVVSGFLTSIKSGLIIQVDIAGSCLFNTSGTYKAFFVADIDEVALEATMANNSANYVHLQISRSSGSQAARNFWDKTLNNNAGGEFTEDVDTAEFLQVTLYVNQTGFSSDIDKIPLALVQTGTAATPAVAPGLIGNIKDRRNMFFRLATGTDPAHDYTLTTPVEDEEDFESADRELKSEKNWKDFVMTKLKKIQGTSNWWEDPPSSLASSLFRLTDGGFWTWAISTPDLSGTGYDFRVVDNARILSPAIPLVSNGTLGGTFTVNSIAGLSVGQVITLYDDTPTTLKCVITNIVGGGAPYTITVERAELSFTADAYYVILGTPYINYIRQATQSPIVLGLEYIAYVDLDLTGTVNLTVNIVKDDNFVNGPTRFIVARRYGASCFVG